MRIELCEDNGLLFDDGRPTLVVLVITTDDVRKIRVPYQADKTIQQLYDDARRLTPKAQSTLESDVPIHDFGPMETKKDINSIIEREDIVKCVELIKDETGAAIEGREFYLNEEYRVVDIIKKNNVVIGYDVIDDKSDFKLRIRCYPCEIKLSRKHRPQPPRITVPDMIKKCDCGEENVLFLQDGIYRGKCERCGAELISEKKDNAKSVA